MTGIALAIYVGYGRWFSWIDIGKFGDRSFAESQLLCIVALLPRVTLLALTLFVAFTRKHLNSQSIGKY